jgi:hypothetical protein
LSVGPVVLDIFRFDVDGFVVHGYRGSRVRHIVGEVVVGVVFTDPRLKRRDAGDAMSLGAISSGEFVEVNTIAEERDGIETLRSAKTNLQGVSLGLETSKEFGTTK